VTVRFNDCLQWFLLWSGQRCPLLEGSKHPNDRGTRELATMTKIPPRTTPLLRRHEVDSVMPGAADVRRAYQRDAAPEDAPTAAIVDKAAAEGRKDSWHARERVG
jgi:hypothetical protein